MDPWHDYAKFTDGALDAFIKRFPFDPDHAAAVAELERRRKERDQRSEACSDQKEAMPIGKGVLVWAIAGIAILALAVLSLALPIFAPRSHRARRPTALPQSFPEPATPVPRSLPTVEDSIPGLYSPKPSPTNTPTPRSSPGLTP